MNVYTVEVYEDAYYIEASSIATATSRGIKAINKKRKEKGRACLGQHLGVIETIKVQLEARETTLKDFLDKKSAR